MLLPCGLAVKMRVTDDGRQRTDGRRWARVKDVVMKAIEWKLVLFLKGYKDENYKNVDNFGCGFRPDNVLGWGQ